jgi:hypothetical protein
MWLVAVVVVVVVVELDPQAASTSAAHATAVPTTASLLSFRFFIMIVLDLLDSNCTVGWFDD